MRLSRGFTLVELVATMAIVGVIGTVLAGVILRAAEANTKTGARGDLYADASTAMDILVRKFRSTPIRGGSNPGCGSILSFDNNLVTWDDQSQLEFTSGSIKLRDVAGGDPVGLSPVEVLGGVTSFTLTPKDKDDANVFTTYGGGPLDNKQSEDITRVVIQFTVSRHGHSVTLRSRAFIRANISGTSS